MESRVGSNIQLPPGFRFHPSDEELIVHYLKNKASSRPIPALIIAEIDIYKYNPWELPKKALFGEVEWYFFTPRERKYPNGARPNRAAASGYWKATGTDKPILTSCGSKRVGVKKALVFYKGRAQKGVKTEWIMHEYRLLETMVTPPKSRGSMRLDDWVLCRVRQKGNSPREKYPDVSRSESASYFSKVEELIRPSTTDNIISPNYDVVTNYLNNGCPLLAYIFASQNITSPVERSSNITNDVSDLNDMFNPLKRKLLDDNQDCNNNENDLSFFRQYLPQENVFNLNPLNPSTVEIQELNRIAFTGRDLLYGEQGS
ncbi:hypothetical protein GIB67_020709 [Kingdonia uniflora]|uniref:NAC domain-containing protein n=1 Tax=Kingdonia uniflora TaxID=39325 RepID=A0A7J7P0Y8_9MAGN|nr:hypothetical protein GIB67_020709 [Kingdonia uniflora]